MERSAIKLLQTLKPELAEQEIGLSFNLDDHIVYTNQHVVSQLGYEKSQALCHLHPFMLSPERQPDGELSSTKSMLMLKKARVLGEHSFPWVHLKADKSEVNCHIHLFDLSNRDDVQVEGVDLFAIWQFKVD